MAWASRQITTKELIRNWIIVYLANLAGALGLVFLVVLSHHWEMNSHAVGINAVKIAAAKAALPFWEAFFKGVICNILVCLAVWLALAGRSVTDKIFAVIFPISAFVAAGFEHSIANMYFIPLGLMLKDRIPVSGAEHLSWFGLCSNLLPVTLATLSEAVLWSRWFITSSTGGERRLEIRDSDSPLMSLCSSLSSGFRWAGWIKLGMKHGLPPFRSHYPQAYGRYRYDHA